MAAKRCHAFVAFALVLVSIGFISAQAQPTLIQKIESKVWADLRAQGKATFFVVLNEQADTSVALGMSDRKDQGQLVVDLLKETVDRTQKPMLDRLAAADAEFTPFWIVNAIKVVTGNEQLIKDLAARPDVAYVKADETWQIPEPLPGAAEPKIGAVEYGVAKVRAPEVWQQFGVRGQGIVVASIDTGVQYNHPALVRQYRGRRPDGTFDHNYNWYDPSRICSPQGTPCDNNGHGTHTMGTMVGEDGANQIGVAPGAKWIAAKGCENSNCSTTALLSAGQWVLAPTDLNGQNPRPDLRPHVVNNSWGNNNGGDIFYQTVVRNWRNAGIFPAFADGNPGSACGAVNVPGAYPESFGVGATDINDNIAGFSGRGPANAFGGIVKPNISAPGVNVRSSMPPNSYGSMSGTSMATPHLAGVVALLWSVSPALAGNIPATFDLLQSTARVRPSTQCGPTGPPNNVYGWGIADALAAVEQSVSGGTLQGRVTNAASGDPLANIEIRAVGPVTRTASTDSNGNYRMVLRAGTYNLTASPFGFRLQTVSVQIMEQQTSTQNFSLQPVPRHAVFGYVYSTLDDQPLANVNVKLLNVELPPATTNADGYYEFAAVPEGAYDLQAGTGGCLSALIQRINVNGDVEADFPLQPKIDDFGYTCVDNAPFNWIEGVDQLPFFIFDASVPVDLPFPFTFYGQTYNRIYVATNGFANFLENRSDFANTCIPDPRQPNAAIYALWDHLFVGFGFFAGVFTKTEGEAPNRVFVIEWRNMTVFGLPPSNISTFEILLDESTGAIVLQYNQAGGQANGARATVGIKSENSTTGLQYSCREPAVSAGKAIVFYSP